MPAELRPGHLLDQLFQRADAAGQRDERVRQLEHLLFAFVQVARDDQLAAVERALALGQEVRDDAGDLAAVVEHGFGKLAHQADRAAAVDQADAVLRQDFAEGAGGLDEGGVGSRAGAAIDADFSNGAHGGA